MSISERLETDNLNYCLEDALSRLLGNHKRPNSLLNLLGQQLCRLLFKKFDDFYPEHPYIWAMFY